MNSEDKIYSKIKSASHKGEKDFPGMDKVWNRVEEKLDNTIVVKKKNTWQKLAIAAIVLLSFSIIYHFVSNDEIIKDKNNNFNNNTENPIIVSNDSAEKIIEKAKEVVVDNKTTIPNKLNSNFDYLKDNLYNKNSMVDNETPDSIIYKTLPNGKITARNFDFPDKIITSNDNNGFLRTDFNNSNSAYNSSSANNAYLAPSKKYDIKPASNSNKTKSASPKMTEPQAQKNKDLVVIDGVAMGKNYDADKELNKISAEEVDDVTHLPNPLYIINGIEYTEESLFGKNPTSPYAPLDKQKITSTTILKPADATKIYGKKGEKGIVIITTKDGKPAEK